MIRIFNVYSIILFSLAASFSTAGFATGKCDEIFIDPESTWSSPVPLFTHLRALEIQEGNRLGIQSRYENEIDPEGGGACAPVSAFNLLQTVRVALRLPLLQAEPVIRKTYQEVGALKAGRVSNSQMLDLFDYFNRYVPGHSFSIRIDQSPEHTQKWHDDHLPGSHTWNRFDPGNLQLQPDTLKMIAYKVESNGKILGRHFVLLEEGLVPGSNLNFISVMDPSKPEKQFKYEIFQEGHNLDTIKLRKPGAYGATDWVLSLDTIFTVSVD